jgi:phosphoserine phosphatase
MIHEFVVVCVSQTALNENFKIELKKLFKDFNLPISKEAEKISTYSYNHLVYFSFDDLELKLFEISLIKLSSIFLIDTAIIPLHLFKTKKKLVVFDMDSTLITAEVIDEMAQSYGIGEKVKQITARAMNGELNFDESLKERVSLLKGFEQHRMNDIIKNLRFTPGAQELCQVLKSKGIKMAIASGGFNYFAEHVRKELQIDYLFANELEIQNNILTGKTTGQIVNAERKSQIIEELAQKEKISPEETVAIGDGANDIPMLLKAGLGIAIHAKDKVQKAANYRINFGPMTHALSFMNDESL